MQITVNYSKKTLMELFHLFVFTQIMYSVVRDYIVINIQKHVTFTTSNITHYSSTLISTGLSSDSQSLFIFFYTQAFMIYTQLK